MIDEFWRSIPNIIWAAVIGLVGVVFGTVITWIGICLQLRHDSKQRERERLMSLRQDVYLFAGKQIGKVLEYLVNFYDANEQVPSEYTPAFEQIFIIGTDETVKAATKLNDFIIQAFCELIPEKYRIDNIRQKLQGLDGRAKVSLKEIEKSNQSMIEYNLKGEIDPTKWAILQTQFAVADNGLQEIQNELEKEYGSQIKLIGALAEECMQKAQRAEELLTPLIVAIRKELNTPFDEKEFQYVRKISNEKWKDTLEKYISSMKSLYEEMLKEIPTTSNKLQG